MTSSTALREWSVDDLSSGHTLVGDLCDEHGTVLIRSGATLDDDAIGALRALGQRTFYSADVPPADPPPDITTPIQPHRDPVIAVQSLRSGMRLAHSICDERGVLLLAANTIVTPRFLQLLRRRHLTHVTVRRHADPAVPTAVRNFETSLTRRLDNLVSELTTRGVHMATTPWSPRGVLSHDALHEHALKEVDSYNEGVICLEDGADDVLAGKPRALRAITDNLTSFMDSIALDLDIIPHLLSLKDMGDDYLFNHCLNSSLLAMTMATHIGFDKKAVWQVGVTGLLNDIGMLEIADDIRNAPRPLNTGEFLEMQRHPVHTVTILGKNRGVDPVVAFAAYQVHERCDGSGYPRGRRRDEIHPFARIVAVADAYSAMTSSRPYRDALHAYDAVDAMLAQARFGGFDTTAMRALLDCISLYPIGSTVRLSNGQMGRVYRSTPGLYDRPVLALVNHDRSDTGHMIALNEHPDVKVVGVLRE